MSHGLIPARVGSRKVVQYHGAQCDSRQVAGSVYTQRKRLWWKITGAQHYSLGLDGKVRNINNKNNTWMSSLVHVVMSLLIFTFTFTNLIVADVGHKGILQLFCLVSMIIRKCSRRNRGCPGS